MQTAAAEGRIRLPASGFRLLTSENAPQGRLVIREKNDMRHRILEFLLLTPPFLLAITFHEFAHGYAAFRLGDTTARDAGRLSMNPLRHLDPIGVIAFFIVKIGWARPVPVNPARLNNPARDMLYVSLAGPAANLLLAAASAAVLRMLALTAGILPQSFVYPAVNMAAASVWINIVLAVFNLVPIPPLDGSELLMRILPADLARGYARLAPFGFIILLVLFYTGILPRLLAPFLNLADQLVRASL